MARLNESVERQMDLNCGREFGFATREKGSIGMLTYTDVEFDYTTRENRPRYATRMQPQAASNRQPRYGRRIGGPAARNQIRRRINRGISW